jgi:FkbM family methyltransferase
MSGGELNLTQAGRGRAPSVKSRRAKRESSLPGVKRLKKLLATYLATGNPRTAYLLNCRNRRVRSVRIPGCVGDVRIRTGTSDALLLREAVLAGFDFREYEVPLALQPRTILDIGANTGIVSLTLRRKYPGARVIAFEPLPENFALLDYNLRNLNNVLTVPVGLGRETTEMEYYASDDPNNLGGGSFHPNSSQMDQARGKLQILSAADALSKFDIRDVDMIKIDTEGAEHDILTGFPEDVISEVSAIVGELHSVKDDETLAFLSRWFDIRRGPLKGRMSLFTAINKSCSSNK